MLFPTSDEDEDDGDCNRKGGKQRETPHDETTS